MKTQIVGKLGVAALALAAAVLSTQTIAATGTQAQGTASVNVIQPVMIQSFTSMSFGSFLAGNGGTLQLTFGGVNPSGDVQPVPSPTSPAPAVVQISAESGYLFEVTLPPFAFLSSNGGQVMAVDNFATMISGNNGAISTIGTGTGLWESAFIFARLNVDSNQAPGNYSGFLPVSVAYN